MTLQRFGNCVPSTEKGAALGAQPIERFEHCHCLLQQSFAQICQTPILIDHPPLIL
jgi:hypothetical protein